MSSDPTTTAIVEQKGPGAEVLVPAYLCGALGLIIILGVAFFIVRKVRLRKAKKYIKQQSKRTIGMGPVLSDQPPPPSTWKWKEVKASIKAKRAGRPVPTVSSGVTNGSVTSNGTSGSRPVSATSLGVPRSQMHGEENTTGHSVQRERMRARVEAKKAKREKKARQKEVKTILTQMLEDKINGTFVPSRQELPGDRFPTLDRQRMAAASSAHPTGAGNITHVGPLRRDSLMAIPNTTYLIERTKGKQPMHKSATSKSLEIPENLHGSSRGNSSSSLTGFGSNRNVQCEVTVHHVTDTQDHDMGSVRSYDASAATTEL